MQSRKRILFFIALPSAIIISMLGGAKLMIYIALLITGIVLGRSYATFKRMYEDYKLGLKVNTVLYSSKQTEQIKKENEQLKSELNQLNERFNMYKSHLSKPKAAMNFTNTHMEDLEHDDQHSDGLARLR